jgi:hypothetical protein
MTTKMYFSHEKQHDKIHYTYTIAEFQADIVKCITKRSDSEPLLSGFANTGGGAESLQKESGRN